MEFNLSQSAHSISDFDPQHVDAFSQHKMIPLPPIHLYQQCNDEPHEVRGGQDLRTAGGTRLLSAIRDDFRVPQDKLVYLISSG